MDPIGRAPAAWSSRGMTPSTTTTIPSPIGQPATVIAQVEALLDECQAAGTRPDDVRGLLVRNGWTDADAHLVVTRYRARFDEHPLGYAGFLFSVGFGALALGSVGHLLLAFADGGDPSRDALAWWLTVLFIAVPFAIWSWRWVERTDASDPVAAWSGPRSTLANVLLWCCGVVGGVRLLHYVYAVASVLAGASDRDLGVGLLNVAITAGITVPLGTWAFRFRHRFDR
jgi:hypothetical protein